jgi:RHS repeat-associated protein
MAVESSIICHAFHGLDRHSERSVFGSMGDRARCFASVAFVQELEDCLIEVYNLRYPGQYYQAETGLNQNTYRDYDPVVGRYIESDPMGLAGGRNTYSYVNGSPVFHRDARGLQEEEEDEEEETPIEQITRQDVDSLVNDIRQYDSGFRYAIIAKPNYRYNRQDIEALENILRQYRSSCSATPRISYGSTPGA